MNISEAIAYINKRPELVFTERDKSGKGWICPVPGCGSGSGHGKHKAGTGVRENPKKPGHFTCFANAHFDGSKSGDGGKSGDVLDWIAATQGINQNDFMAKLKAGCKLAGISLDGQDGEKNPYPTGNQRKAAAIHSAAKAAKDEISDADKAKIQKARQDAAAYIAKSQANLEQGREYLAKRGISLETAKRHGLGYYPRRPITRNGKTLYLPVIVIPGGHYYTTRTAQDCDNEYRHDAPKAVVSTEKTKPPINLEALDGDGVIFVCEGVFDMLSVEEAGGAAVPLNSASNTGDFFEMLDGRQFGGRFIIALDNDKAGHSAAARLEDGLKKRKITYLRANVEDLDANCKDLNDLWVKNPDAFREWVKTATSEALALPEMGDAPMAAEYSDAASDVPTIHQAKEMPKPNRYSFLDGDWANSVDSFFENIQTEKYKLRPTGIAAFDWILGGGFMGGSVNIIGGAPGQGKTMILQWLTETMLKTTHELTAVFMNFEMSRDKLLARTFANRLGGEYSTRDILQGFKWTDKARQDIGEAIQAYRDTIGKRLLYNPLGASSSLPTREISKVKELIEATATATEKKGKLPPIVVCDYLQLLQDGNDDTKKTIGNAMAMLKDYAEKHNAIVLAAMANGRADNRTGNVGIFSGRDSSALEYGADCIMQLEADPGADGKPLNNERRIKVVKGRDFGTDEIMVFDLVKGIIKNPRLEDGNGNDTEANDDTDVHKDRRKASKSKISPIELAERQKMMEGYFCQKG